MTTSKNFSEDVMIRNEQDISQLLGTHDKHLKFLEEQTETAVTTRGDIIHISGEEAAVNISKSVLEVIQELMSRGNLVSTADFAAAIQMARKGTLDYFLDMYEETLIKDFSGKPIKIKNLGQRHYINAIRRSDVVFGIGPAGTGKTFLAVVMAISAMKKGEVQKIILTRPAVEAGESLGFLPGDLQEKVNPYLRPVYDALYSILGVEHTNRLMERGVIEIAPLAYMRGRTLEESFVILDEAQNTSISQMKMFLTRLGFRSKMVINGDKTQIDLPRGVVSGLVHAEMILKGLKKIEFVEFDTSDVVRHPVVADIIKAYEENN